MKTLSVPLAPQHLIPKTTKPNLNQHSKEKKKNNKKILQNKNLETQKNPKTPPNPLNHDTPLVVKRIKSPPPQKKPSSTRPHSLYKQKIKIKNQKIPTQNKNQIQTKTY